jgi:hypothetical protein
MIDPMDFVYAWMYRESVQWINNNLRAAITEMLLTGQVRHTPEHEAELARAMSERLFPEGLITFTIPAEMLE